MPSSKACVLVVTSIVTDATLICEMLQGDQADIVTSTNAGRFVADFERVRPQVLILAFKSVAESERLTLNLVRHNTSSIPPSYQTILLCQKEEVGRAYELCKLGYFDDYVMFWPLVYDAPRLAMALHLALRSRSQAEQGGGLGQVVSQARRISDLERQLEEQLAVGNALTGRVKDSLDSARDRLGVVVDEFSRRLCDTGLEKAVVVRDRKRIDEELRQFREEGVWPPLDEVDASSMAVAQWVDGLRTALNSPLEAARTLAGQLHQLPHTLLVVDDDEFMRKLLARVLAAANYAVVAVGTGHEALLTLRKRAPDLIIMDVDLPDISGIEVTRRLKRTEDYATIPVIMLTGHGEKEIVLSSCGAGADDYVVKPFDRDVLLQKVSRRLS